jgi:Mlc titration factor MtfA (ptsG expression regulator)
MRIRTLSLLLIGGILLALIAIPLIQDHLLAANRMKVEYRYLLVSAEGFEKGQNQHSVSLIWKDKKFSLPILIKVDQDEKLELGAEANSIFVKSEKLEVQIEPASKFVATNMPVVAFIPESEVKSNTFSTATWVLILPPGLTQEPNTKKLEDELSQ